MNRLMLYAALLAAGALLCAPKAKADAEEQMQGYVTLGYAYGEFKAAGESANFGDVNLALGWQPLQYLRVEASGMLGVKGTDVGGVT